MLRYRVAIMLLIFFLLGIAFHKKFTTLSLNYLWASISLLSSYVAATTVNDIADKNIDKINHPKNKERPLISGEATEKDLYYVHILAVTIVITFALLIGIQAFMILLLSLIINYIYSLSPFKISYRTYLAPLILSFAYVFIPYYLGVVVGNFTIQGQELFFIFGLLFLFFGRIILKDFRDRKGDAMYGKPTFLLKYGKNATCLLSFVSIILGNIFIFLGLPIKNLIIFSILEVYFITIYFMIYKLSKVNDHNDEQVAIGIGAKMGNGLLLTILSFLVLLEYQAPIPIQILFILIITTVFLINFLILIRDPKYVIIGYKG
jgi:4-hydroxybenzoate polyprenyltransferase